MQEQIIDLDLGAHLVRKDQAFAKDMIGTLVQSLVIDRQKLEHAYQQQDWKQILELVHRIKGAASYCGTPRLQAISTMFLQYLHSNETERRENLYADFMSEISAVENAFKSL